jgi:D-aminopeptidase
VGRDPLGQNAALSDSANVEKPISVQIGHIEMSVATTLNRYDEAKVDEIFQSVNQCHKPGGAVGLAIGGIPVYRKGFGLANIELPTPISPAMRLRIGSTTKHFACLSYMLLCEEGVANLDDPVEKHIPEIHRVAHGVTMRQLMGHISGLRDAFTLTMVTNGFSPPVTDKQMLSYYTTIADADFSPGSAWCYNNGGYVLLTAAIERLSNQAFEEFLRMRILEPVGLYDTELQRWERDFVPNSATLHMIDSDGNFNRDYMGMEITGAGGIVSTVDDMLRWLRHMDSPIVGTANTWRLMREPLTLSNGTSTGYGLGLMSATYRGVEVLMHSGGVMGGNSQMIKIPSAALDITIALNRSDTSAVELAFKAIDLLVDGLDEERKEEGAERIIGLFVSPTTGRVVELSEKDEKQCFSYDGAMPMPVELDSAGVIQLPEAARFVQTNFAITESSGTLSEFNVLDVMERAESAAVATVGVAAGDYRAETICTAARIFETENGAMLDLRGPHGGVTYKLEPLTNRIWRATGTGASWVFAGIVTFGSDDGGSFEFTVSRLKRVRFARV